MKKKLKLKNGEKTITATMQQTFRNHYQFWNLHFSNMKKCDYVDNDDDDDDDPKYKDQ